MIQFSKQGNQVASKRPRVEEPLLGGNVRANLLWERNVCWNCVDLPWMSWASWVWMCRIPAKFLQLPFWCPSPQYPKYLSDSCLLTKLTNGCNFVQLVTLERNNLLKLEAVPMRIPYTFCWSGIWGKDHHGHWFIRGGGVFQEPCKGMCRIPRKEIRLFSENAHLTSCQSWAKPHLIKI